MTNPYVAIRPEYTVHRNPEGLSWFRETSDPREMTNDMLVDDKIKLIVDYCDGTHTVSEICSLVSARFQPLETENTIEDLVKKNVLEFYAVSTPIPYTGSSEFFIPRHLSVELTTACPFSCRHCYRDVGEQSSDFINTEKLFRLVSELAPVGLKIVELTGGECLCHPDFVEIVNRLAEIPQISLIGVLTNGWLLDEALIERLKPAGKKLVFSISLDSSSPEFHDEFRRKAGAWEHATNAIRVASSAGLLTRVAMSYIPANFFDIEKTLLLAKSLGAGCFAFSPVMPDGRGSVYAEAFQLFMANHTVDEIVQYLNGINEKYKGFLNTVDEARMEQIKAGKENCGLGVTSWVISPKGDVRPCVMMPEGFLSLGNIYSDTIEQLYTNPLVRILHDTPPPRQATCGECVFGGMCPHCIYQGLKQAKKAEKCALLDDASFASLLTFAKSDDLSAGACRHNMIG